MSRLRLFLTVSAMALLARGDCWSKILPMMAPHAAWLMQDSGAADNQTEATRKENNARQKASAERRDDSYKKYKTHKKSTGTSKAARGHDKVAGEKKDGGEDAPCRKGGTPGERPCDPDKK